MNWTGGTLSRHSKKGQNALVEKQKQHFANARAKQQTLRGTPARPKIFGEEVDEDESDARSRRHESNTSAQRQSRLDAFDDFAPVVNRLSSMVPRSSKQNHVVSRHSAKQSQHQENTSSETVKHTIHQSAKRKRSTKDPAGISTTAARDVINFDENELGYQRRQLLTKRDWVGLQAPTDRGYEDLRKRRRIEPQIATNIDYNKRVYVSSIREHAGPHMAALPSESVQIRIGEDALTSRMSQTQSVRSPVGRVSSQPPSSSSMLVDDHAQVTAKPRRPICAISNQEVVGSDGLLAHLKTPTRDDFFEATDEEYGNGSRYEWPVSSDYGRAAQNGHDLQQHGDSFPRADFTTNSLLVEDQAQIPLETTEVPNLVEGVQSVPKTSRQVKDAENAHIQQNTVQTIAQDTDDAWQSRVQLSPGRLQHSPPIAAEQSTQSQRLNKLFTAPSVPKPMTKQAQSTASTSDPTTPASLVALDALCQRKALSPPMKPPPPPQVEDDDADAIWKAFVFGMPKSPSGNAKSTTENLTKTAKAPTASMEVGPATPTRKHRSSSILTSIASDSNNADAKTTAATVGHSSSSAFQSDDERAMTNYSVSEGSSHCRIAKTSPLNTAMTNSDFDRVSSIANASTIPAMIRTTLPVLRRSSPDPLIADHDQAQLAMSTNGMAKRQSGFKKPKIIFNRLRPFDGGAASVEEESYEIVHIGQGGGRRARAILRDAEGEGEEMDDIEEI